ncbi:MAG: phospholipase A [Pseudomarimonas sp.]
MSLLVMLMVANAAHAQPDSQACVSIDDTQARLVCYDTAHGRESSGPWVADVSERSEAARAEPTSSEPTSTLDALWELDAAHKRGTFNLLPHHANYLLLGRYSDNPNNLPNTPSPDHQLDDPLQVDPTEAKFQFSVKVKAWENLFGDNGDIWFAYTQQSNWQVYNSDQSAPFRETNYEPEGILSFRTDWSALGWRWRLLNLGFVHQSNGRPLPLSRSWNRAYAQFGFERGNLTVLARPWFRISENESSDDNPDITRFTGSGDLRLTYSRAGHHYSALGRYSDTGKRGSVQLEWAFPISGLLKGYVQATSGYGESLLDYNHSQNTLGVGVLLVPWQ